MAQTSCLMGVSATVLLAGSLAVTGLVRADTWPVKPIRAFIPFASGSATDIIPRAVFDRVGPALGQPIVIENRLGAGGAIGARAVAAAPA